MIKNAILTKNIIFPKCCQCVIAINCNGKSIIKDLQCNWNKLIPERVMYKILKTINRKVKYIPEITKFTLKMASGVFGLG